MKFSRLECIDWSALGSTSASSARHADRLETLQARGYRGLWLSEPPRDRAGVPPTLSLLAAGLATASAAAGDDFEIGLVTTLRPYMHPLRVAEEIAMLDIASEGRVRWATLGEGHFDARAREQLEIIQGAATGAPVSHDGAFYRFDDVQCHPAPHRSEGPPLQLVTGDPEVATWARERELEVVWDASNAATAPEPSVESTWMVSLYVAPDEGAADLPAPGSGSGAVVSGGANACRESLGALRAKHGFDHVVARFEFGTLTPEQAAESEARFLAEVLPAFD